MATRRQKKAIANLVENGGIVSKAMVDAGYSPATAKTPQKLTDSIGFKTLAERIPDDLLEQVHIEGLSADFKGEPDYGVRHKYLDSAYKLKGSYAPEKHVNLNIDAPVSDRIKKIAETLNES